MVAEHTISLAEFPGRAAALARKTSLPVAIQNENHIIGYFVPKSVVDTEPVQFSDSDAVQKIVDTSIKENKDILIYLQDK